MAELQISRAAMQESRKILPHGNRQMEFADLEIKQKIGQGGFGMVFIGYWKDWSGVVAIKQVDDAASSVQEVRMLCALKHPNIITLYGTASNDSHLYIVMELAELGSLYEHIQKSRGQPDMKLSLRWAVDIAEGMSYIHEKGFAYRDLKSRKVLLTSTRTAKICGNCVVREMDHTTKASMTGIFQWMAPEVIQQAAYSKSCDLFSYGTVLWELMTHEVPFEGRSTFQIMMLIVGENMPAIPAAVEGFLSTLIQQCWNMDPYRRPSFVEVLEVLKPHLQAMDVPAVVEPEIRKIDYKDIQFGDVIGSGSFGTVCIGHWDDRSVAIKKVSTAVNMEREVDIMAKLLHANIVTLYATASKHPEFCIIMELAECSLYSHIEKHKDQPDMELSLRWATQVAEGMKYLHGKEIVHRDLKSANVLLTNDLKVAKLCDFGIARQLDNTVQATTAGTVQWMAPEVINAKAYSKRCDLFSYGIVLWELVTHKAPFEGTSTLDILNAIVAGKMPCIPVELEAYLCSLMQQCWKVDPDERPIFSEILQVLHEKEMIPEHAIKMADLDIGNEISSGTYGEVFEGVWTLKERRVAIKRMHYDEKIMEEVRLMSELKYYANIITLYGTASRDPHLYIVMELAECSLYKHIKDHRGKPDMKRSLRWAVEVAKGMRYLHGKGIVHRDLKSPNVLLTNDLKVAKLCDFGIARHLDQIKATSIGTVKWMAPEVIKQEQYCETCDVFSYGTVLWELVTHEVPFDGLNAEYPIKIAITTGKMPVIPDSVEGYLSTLIQQCWNMDPKKRPSFDKMLPVLRKDQQCEDWDEEEEEEIKANSKPQLQHLEMLPCTKTAIRMAAEIKDNWPRVASRLYIPKSIKKEIKQQSSDPEQQALTMLKRWWVGDYKCDDSDDELPAPTWAILMAALVGSGYGELADRIRQRMAPST